ncbi:hypothetical protein ACLOJK_036672 [Asimina triloba]
MGEPFDEVVPQYSVLETSSLACRVLDIMNQVDSLSSHQKDIRRASRERKHRRGETLGYLLKKDRDVKNLNYIWLYLSDLWSIDPEVKLVLFLWLLRSAMIYPSSLNQGHIRWSYFWVACQIVGEVRFSVAPRVLCDLYRGLNKVVYHERGPGRAVTYYPSHFFFAWLRTYFPFMFRVTNASQFDDAFHMGKFARRPFIRQDLAGVTRTFLRMDNLRQNFYRVVASSESTNIKDSSVGLFINERDFFLSLQPCMLPLRDKGTFHVEPYFPHKFARQFGYNQGVSEQLAMISREAREVAQRQLLEQRLLAFKPWDLSLPYYYRSDHGREVMMGVESGIEMTSPARILWINLACAPETSTSYIHYRKSFRCENQRLGVVLLLLGQFALPLALCHRSVNTPRNLQSHVVKPAIVPYPSEDERAPGSPIDLSDSSEEAPLEGDRETTSDRSPGRGFDEALGEATRAIDVIKEAVVAPMTVIVSHRSPIGSTRSGGEVSITVGRASATLISESVSIVPAAHSLRSFGHISLPLPMLLQDVLRDLPRMFIERALAAREIEGPARRSASKSVDAALRSAAELVAPVKGRAAEAIVPDSDEGSGGNSSVGQHVPTGGDRRVAVSEGPSWREGFGRSSSGPAFLLDVNVEPFRELVSSCSAWLQRSLPLTIQRRFMYFLSFFREAFIRGLDDVEDPDDFDYLLKLCGNLKQSLRYFSEELEHEHQHHLASEIENQLVEECEAEVAIISVAKTRIAGIDAKLLACRKAMEERKESIIRDPSLLWEMERRLVSALSDLKKIKEAEVSPPSLA